MKHLFLYTLLLCLLSACEKDISIKPSLQLSKQEITLKIGEQQVLTVTHTPSELETPEYTWSSSDYKIAVIDKGKVVAMAEGEATVSATATKYGITVSCKVRVEPVNAADITLSLEKDTLEIGQSRKLTYTIRPINTTHQEVEWQTSDPNIATVVNGNVTAVAHGTANILVWVKNTTIIDTCQVYVKPIRVGGITLNASSQKVEYKKKVLLTATVTPDNAKDKSVRWTSSDENIATVEDGLVTAVNKGTCQITARTNDGGFSAQCSIEVTPASVSSINIANNSATIVPGKTHQIKVDVQPSYAENKAVTYRSEDESIATVDANGLITAKATGRTTIDVTTVEGGFKSYFYIEVTDITDMIKLYFPISSIMISNGFATGDVFSGIVNQSPYAITLTKFEVIDSYDGRTTYQTTDPSRLGRLSSDSQASIGVKIMRLYNPVFKWYFTFEGKAYSVSHRLNTIK